MLTVSGSYRNPADDVEAVLFILFESRYRRGRRNEVKSGAKNFKIESLCYKTSANVAKYQENVTLQDYRQK
jgi:hypothetical protein